MAKTKTTDYTAALRLAGETDPEKASGLFKLVDQFNKLKGLLALIGIDVDALLKKLVAKYVTDRKKADKTAPAPATAPAETPPAAPPPVTAPVPAAPSARTITRIVVRYYWLAHDNKLANKAHWDNVMTRRDPVIGGDKVCLNASPYDQFGQEIASDGQHGVDRPGFTGRNWTPELDAAMWYPDNSSRLRWFVEGGIGVMTGREHQRGFTPKIEHEKDTLANDQEAELGEVYGIYTSPGGQEIRTNTLHSLRAKG